MLVHKRALPKKLPDQTHNTTRLVEYIKNIDKMFANPSSCFGMDQKVQYHLEVEKNYRQIGKYLIAEFRSPFFPDTGIA